MGQAGLRTQERASRVHRHHQIEALDRRVGGRGQADCRRIVYEYVNAAEVLRSAPSGSSNRSLVTYIANDRQRMTSCGLYLPCRAVDGARQFGMGLVSFGGDSDVGAIACGTKRDGEPNTSGRAGDEQGLVAKAHQRTVPSPHEDLLAAKLYEAGLAPRLIELSPPTRYFTSTFTRIHGWMQH